MVFSNYFMSGFVSLNPEAVGIQRKNLIFEGKNTSESCRLATYRLIEHSVKDLSFKD